MLTYIRNTLFGENSNAAFLRQATDTLRKENETLRRTNEKMQAALTKSNARRQQHGQETKGQAEQAINISPRGLTK